MIGFYLIALGMLVGLLVFAVEQRKRHELQNKLTSLYTPTEPLDDEPTKPYVVSKLRETLDSDTLATIARSTRDGRR